MSAEMMSYDDAAEYLRMKMGTLYCMVSRRRIPHVRLGPRLVRFRRADLEAWLEARSVGCGDGAQNITHAGRRLS